MKVILVNGSPHEKGCTYTALTEVSDALRKNDIEAEIFNIGTKPLSGCIACMHCKKSGTQRCVFDDTVNEFLEKAVDVDGFIFGSPVHYAAMGGAITSFMDRAFFAGGSIFRLKPGAGIVSARRCGTTASFDQLIKYFTISEMPVISSKYWNMVHGSSPEDVKKDLEGLQIMRVLGNNMAWFLKCKEAALKAGISLPENEDKIKTNFIR